MRQEPHEMGQEQVKALRASLGLTQDQLASRLGISSKAIQHWEQGLRTPRGLYLKVLQQEARKLAKEQTR